MSDKVTLANVGDITQTTTAANTINSNSAAIVAAMDNTLSRDGTTPNQMGANLDMNSNHILNLPTPASDTEPARLSDITSVIDTQVNAAVSVFASQQLTFENTVNTSLSTALHNPMTTNLDMANHRIMNISSPASSSDPIRLVDLSNFIGNSAQNPPNTAINLGNFGGRLTALSGTPVPTVDVIGSQNLYYAPFVGKTVPTYSAAGGWALQNITTISTDQVGLTLALAGSSSWAANTIHDVFAVFSGGTVKLATRLWDSAMFGTEVLITPATAITTGSTPTTSWSSLSAAFDGTTSKGFASCATITPSNAGLANCIGQDWGSGNSNVVSKVVVYAPNDHTMNGTGVANNTQTFFVEGSNDNTNWHRIVVWRGDDTGSSGTVFTIPINIVEQQAYRYHRISIDGVNGSSAIRLAQLQFFKRVPASNRRLTLLDGVLVNDDVVNPMRTGAATTISTAQFEGTYLGTIHIDSASNGQVTVHQTYGLTRTCGIWNAYNRRKLKLQVGSYATVTTYRTTSQLWNLIENTIGSTDFTMSIVQGLAEEPIVSALTRTTYQQTALGPVSYEAGIGVDTPLTFSGMEWVVNTDTSGLQSPPISTAIGFTGTATCTVPPRAGLRTLYGLERQGNNGTGVQDISTGVRNSAFIAEFNY